MEAEFSFYQGIFEEIEIGTVHCQYIQIVGYFFFLEVDVRQQNKLTRFDYLVFGNEYILQVWKELERILLGHRELEFSILVDKGYHFIRTDAMGIHRPFPVEVSRQDDTTSQAESQAQQVDDSV